ncbi:hypothetical protein ACWDSD_19590 [Streptomyces spiralis]
MTEAIASVEDTSGTQICVGTHLTDLMISEVAFLTPAEVIPGLYYASL